MGHTISHCFPRPQKSQSVLEHNELKYVPSSTLSLADLPPELIIYNILPYVTYLDLCSLSQVNKMFKILIDANDQLWKNAIKTEMLEELQTDSDNNGHQQEQVLPIFESAKTKFQYLHEQRQKLSLIEVNRIYACGITCGFQKTLFHKYITIRPSINVIQKEKARYKLYIYFSHGESQNDLNPDMLDTDSQLFVTEPDVDPNEIWCLIPSQSTCLKCKSKCYYPPRSCSQPQPYNWFVSYFEKKKYHARIEVIEIYCNKCQRFSLWRYEIQGSTGLVFKPPKSHKNDY